MREITIPTGLLGVCLLLTSCTHQTNQPRQSETDTLDFQRFIPINSPNPLIEGVQPGNVALDTRTGRICKSWDWQQSSSSLNSIPECYKIFINDAVAAGKAQ